MLFNSLNYVVRFVRTQYRVFADRMLDRRMKILDRLRYFFMFVGLLTLLGVIAFFSLIAFVVFGAIALVLTGVFLLYSWIYRLLHPGTTRQDTFPPRIFIWHTDFGADRNVSPEVEIYDVESHSIEDTPDSQPPSRGA